MEQIFTNIYETKLWGNNKNSKYSGGSGEGSQVAVNKTTYIPFLQNFIRERGITSVVDLGCGDFVCGRLIYNALDVKYTGYDVYKKVVDYNATVHPSPKYTFIHLDFLGEKENIVGGDLCVIKDVIQHWSLENIYVFLDYLVETKKFKYILITNCCQQTKDNTTIKNGDFRRLSSEYLPLKKYSPKSLYKYHTKEVCLITTQ